MKTPNHSRFIRSLALFTLLLTNFYSYPAVFNTIAPGSWTNSSTWGGAAPPTDISGHTVNVNHNVTVLNNDIKLLNNARLNVNGVSFTMQNGNFTVERGTAVFTGANVHIAHGFSLQLTKSTAVLRMVNCQVFIGQNFQNSEGKRYLENVCLVVDESFQNAKGVDTLINVCAIIGNNSSGNYQNDSGSSTYIQDSEFRLPNGNFQNQSSAILTGTITAIWLQNGSLQNVGTWTAFVSNYCVSQSVSIPSAYRSIGVGCAGISSFFNPCNCSGGTGPNITLTPTPAPCFGQSSGYISTAVSGGTAPFTYLWSNGATTQSLSNIPAGTYTVTVTSSGGGSSTATTTVSQPPALNASISSTNVLCFGGNTGSATITASGGTPAYTYLWNTGQTSSSIGGLGVGNYSVTVTDANGCTSIRTVSITQPPQLNASSSAGTITCNGGVTTVLVTASGGTPPYTGTGTFTRGAGAYAYTVTDANGCTAIATGVINQPPPINIHITSGTIPCFGGNTNVTVSASAGTAPYTGTGTFTRGAGTWSFTVSDANSCSVTGSITITQPTSVSVVTTSTNVTTNGGTNGTATAVPSGGTPPYTYLWSTGATTAQITGLSAGFYTVTITDANNCTTTGTVIITQPPGGCHIAPGKFTTYTQGGWGASNCNSTNNAACYRNANFAAAFPNGLTVGCTFTLKLTTAAAVDQYLPCGPSTTGLTQNYINPKCLKSVFSGQVIAATLSVVFDQYDPNFSASTTRLADLVVASGTFAGWTVQQLLNEANKKLGGCTSPYSFSQLNTALTNVNENFVGGTVAGNYLICPSNVRVGPTQGSNPELNVRAFPNPFTGELNLNFELKEKSDVLIEIYSMKTNAKVATYDLGMLEEGEAGFLWDGTNNSQEGLSAGIYLIRIITGKSVDTVKVVRL